MFVSKERSQTKEDQIDVSYDVTMLYYTHCYNTPSEEFELTASTQQAHMKPHG